MADVRQGNFNLDKSFHNRSVAAPTKKRKSNMDDPMAKKGRGKKEPKSVYEQGDNIQPTVHNYRAGEAKSVRNDNTLPMTDKKPNVTVTRIEPGNKGKPKRKVYPTKKLGQ